MIPYYKRIKELGNDHSGRTVCDLYIDPLKSADSFKQEIMNYGFELDDYFVYLSIGIGEYHDTPKHYGIPSGATLGYDYSKLSCDWWWR